MSDERSDAMPELLAEMFWSVPLAGEGHFFQKYSIRPSLPDSPIARPELVLVEPYPRGGWKDYNPMREETGLFRTFADTDPTPEGCLAFAERYGPLGGSANYLLINTGVQGPVNGEPLRVWRAGIIWLNYLIRLWEAAKADDSQALAGMVQWDEYAVHFLNLPAERAEIPLPEKLREKKPPGVRPIAAYPLVISEGVLRPFDFGPITGASLKRGDLVAPAMLFVAVAINSAMRGLVEYGLAWDTERRIPAATLRPTDLWGAMCLQFLLAVDGARNYHRCPVCRRWFELSPGLNRAHKVYCSGACRTRAVRLKQDEAIRLKGEGKTLKQIAAAVGSGVDQIKKWVAPKGGK